MDIQDHRDLQEKKVHWENQEFKDLKDHKDQ